MVIVVLPLLWRVQGSRHVEMSKIRFPVSEKSQRKRKRGKQARAVRFGELGERETHTWLHRPTGGRSGRLTQEKRKLGVKEDFCFLNRKEFDRGVGMGQS